MNLRTVLLQKGANYLSEQGVANPRIESEILLSQILKCRRIELYLENSSIEEQGVRSFWNLLSLRAKGHPLQYLVGNTEFMGLGFKVAPGVFIPRPETEILVETIINLLNNSQTRQAANRLTVLDIGTGCGNIAISLAKHLTDTTIFACDISDNALQLAEENARLNQVKIYLVKSDLFSAFKRGKYFSLIACNPPYIKSRQIAALPRELNFEPRPAYDGGADGLVFYNKIINQAADYLQEQGILACELADGQANKVKEILGRKRRFKVLKITKDYNEIERVIIAEKI